MSRILAAFVAIAFLLLGVLALLLATRTTKPLDYLAAALYLATAWTAWVRKPQPHAAREVRQRHLRQVFIWAGAALAASFFGSVSV